MELSEVKLKLGEETERIEKLTRESSISDRPSIGDQKQKIGDFEIKTVIGQNYKGALLKK